MELTNVTVHAKANLYFEGRVVSHTVITSSGEHKTVGVILPGTYHFGTGKAERMEIVAGSAEVIIDGEDNRTSRSAGDSFHVPANSGFSITVTEDACHYLCSFLDA